MIPMNDLARREDLASGALEHKIIEVLKSGAYILGTEVASFEVEFAKFLGVQDVVAVATGTDALTIALRALGVQRADSVAIMANAGGYTMTSLVQIGAAPVYVDCDDSAQMDPASLRKCLSEYKTVKVVVVTHLYGLTANLLQIRAICDEFDVLLLEDCAQSAGAQLGKIRAGSVGDVATFSFYPTKNLGSVGDAGATASSSQLAQKIRRLRQYGWDKRYEVTEPDGVNSRMDEIHAAVLKSRLGGLDASNQRRRDIWESFSKAFSGSDWRLVGANNTSFVAHLAVVIAPEGLANSARAFLRNQGIATDIHYPILDYQQLAWKGLGRGNCPVAETLVPRCFSIPLFPELTDDEVDDISGALRFLATELIR